MKRFLSCVLFACVVMSMGIFGVEATTATNTYICNIDFNSASGTCTTAVNSISNIGRMFLPAVANNTTSIKTAGDNRYVSFDYAGDETVAKVVGTFSLNENEVLDDNYSISFDYNNISALSSFDVQVNCFENLQSSYVPLTINPDGSVIFVGSKFTNTGITKGNWHTIVMNFNTNTQSANLTVDGTSVAEAEWTFGGIKHTTDNTAVYFRIARVLGGSDSSIIYLDNVKMYNTEDTIDYNVDDEPTVVVKNATGDMVTSITNGTYTVGVDSSVIKTGDKVFIATYGDSQLIGVNIYDASGSVTIDDNIDTLKVFVVNPITLASSIAPTVLKK